MEQKRMPQTCRWAEPTLFLPMPYWLDAWEQPWTCHGNQNRRLIDAPDACGTCLARQRPAPFGTE
jgi:hypothetical protein